MAKTRIVLWGAWYGSKNVGDQALLLSITDMLGGAIVDVEFVVITDNPDQVFSYIKKDSSYAFLPLHARKQFHKIINVFMRANLFIFGGGVPFYDDWFHSLVIVIWVTLAKAFHVPCILWSVSSQKINSKFTKLVLRYLLSYAAVVTYRDEHTHELFRDCGRKDRLQQLVADAVFTLRLGDKRKAEEILKQAGWLSARSRPLVALTPRFLRGDDGEAHTHYSPQVVADRQGEMAVFASMLDWLWENEYQPIFIPMNTAQPDDDRDAAREVMANAKFGQNAILIDEQIFPRDAANVYSYCVAAFVARVHGAVTAFLGRCPTLMYAFDLKHIGIMEQMGASKWIFDPHISSLNDAINLMEKMLHCRVDLAIQMEGKSRELQIQAKIPKDAVLQLLNRE